MSDSISDAEKIRNKRLAKLGTAASSASAARDASTERPQSQSQSQSQSAAPASSAQPTSTAIARTGTIKEDKAPPASATSTENPFAQLGVAQTPATTSTKINITPVEPTENTRKRALLVDDLPLEEWQDRQLRTVFRLTFDPEERQDRRGNRLFYLPEARAGLEEQGVPLKLEIGLLDQLFVEVARHLDAKTTPFEYFLSAWKRLGELWRKWKGKPRENEKRDVIEEARRLCMSYCIFSVTVPDDLFGRPASSNLLAHHLLIDQDDERGLDHDFLSEISIRLPDDEDAISAIVGAAETLSKEMRVLSMSADYKPHVLALRTLVRFPSVVDALVNSELFLPSGVSAATMEVSTLLGPFFQISPLQAPVTRMFFPNPRTDDKGAIRTAQDAARMSLRAHQTDLDDIVDKFIRRSKDTRSKMLDWFAKIVNLNHKRRAIQVDHKEVSSDGFMLNVTSCLDSLCSPFMDAQFSKLDRIDPAYLRRDPRVDITDETKINADQKASDDFYSQKAEGESNFISEVFFLNVAAHHYGTEAVSTSLSKLERELKELDKYVTMLEGERAKVASSRPQLLPALHAQLDKYRDQLDKGLAYKHSVQAVLLDKNTQSRSMQFMRYVIVWMLKLVSKDESYPKQPLALPLPEEQADIFKNLPEYFVEDVVGNFKFIVTTMPDILTSTQSEELVTLCVTFLRSSEYIKNPYLKAGLVTILFTGTWPVYTRSKGVLTELLNSLPICTDHLLHSVMKFYIEVENTGRHTQFYDKFNIRYEIFQIIKSIWSNRVFRDRLGAEAKVNRDFFVRFVNLLLNDVTYVLDEALTSLNKIQDLQRLLDSPEGQDLDPQAKQQKESALSEAQGKAKSYMQLTNDTMEMLNLFTEALPESFTVPEIVQRLADMLDYNLDLMVGPRSSQLAVRDKQQYSFDPGSLLASIIGVYLNLQNQESLVTAIARDGRSYKHETFLAAEKRLRSRTLRAPNEIDDFINFAEKVKKAKELDDEEEEDYGDVPDEYLDGLMFTIMEDPVILPTSNSTLDRATIMSHLLSDPTDPFNRQPLKIEDVVPNTELKAKINAFKAEKKAHRQANKDAMDTS